MDLQQFISESLTQISEGIKNAQAKTEAHGTKINPNLKNISSNNIGHMPEGCYLVMGKTTRLVSMVQFDIALTITTDRTTEGKIGIGIAAVGLGTKGQSKNTSAELTRVKFQVPIDFNTKC